MATGIYESCEEWIERMAHEEDAQRTAGTGGKERIIDLPIACGEMIYLADGRVVER